MLVEIDIPKTLLLQNPLFKYMWLGMLIFNCTLTQQVSVGEFPPVCSSFHFSFNL